MIAKLWPVAGKVLAACAVMLAALIFLYVPQTSSADGQAMMLPVDEAPLVASTPNGERVFSVEIADETAERAAGLMFRETMPDDRGMLFVFEETRPIGFWMKNTPMPLDLIFIGPDGRVKAIMPGEPYSEAAISPGQPVRYVLELKAGTAAKQGISDGVLVKHPRIVESPLPSEAPSGNGN
ncbi:hypothetical protein ASD64_14240 [Mesorhizobium sp. Root157]|uniref:DUF192 domain-containing protein n=1 Tax=Mesorhizobium sp. Root157 TaxID=1736477 RepID=UPI0006FAAAFF|nr:DUF192 domain-containing protein [Mesorhizobium sp. Root157]KQZ99501.1 hypothetical protein ASD64_14240 [Mesorhizobium sp. Root157]